LDPIPPTQLQSFKHTQFNCFAQTSGKCANHFALCRRQGVVVSVVRRTNEVTLSRTRLVHGNVTSAGWQVTLCDPISHVSSRSGVATLRTAIHLLLTYFTYLHGRVTAIPSRHVTSQLDRLSLAFFWGR